MWQSISSSLLCWHIHTGRLQLQRQKDACLWSKAAFQLRAGESLHPASVHRGVKFDTPDVGSWPRLKLLGSSELHEKAHSENFSLDEPVQGQSPGPARWCDTASVCQPEDAVVGHSPQRRLLCATAP